MKYMVYPDGFVFQTDTPDNHPTAELVTKVKGERLLREQSRKKLLPYFKRKNAVIYSIIRTVTNSGMSRAIDFYVVDKGQLTSISGHMANVLGYHRNKAGAVRVQGCGMDMAFHCVYAVACSLKVDHKKVRSEIL